MWVEWEDLKGNWWLMDVPAGTNPVNYKKGVYVGPPDLHELSVLLKEDQIQSLQEGLVRSRLVNLQLIKGNRTQLVKVIQETLPEFHSLDKVRQIIRLVNGIYQRELWED
jgi:hypothetical protein